MAPELTEHEVELQRVAKRLWNARNPGREAEADEAWAHLPAEEVEASEPEPEPERRSRGKR